jgi:hypothetical protein
VYLRLFSPDQTTRRAPRLNCTAATDQADPRARTGEEQCPTRAVGERRHWVLSQPVYNAAGGTSST